MKTVVGFTFTEIQVQRLRSEGFNFSCNEETLKNGYREFICPLAENKGSGLSIELREVLDEEIYFQFQEKNSFAPFENMNSGTYNEVKHPNSILYVESLLGKDLGPKIENGELKDFLLIRKQYPIWAVWIKCTDFELFCRSSKPDKIFKFNNQDAALIHLGQSCFDLLITQN